MADIINRTLADPAVTAIGTAIVVAGVAIWLAAAWWAYADAARRTDSQLAALVVAGWIVLSTPLLLPFSLAIYALARPQQTAAEHRTRSLAAELVGLAEMTAAPLCPGCRAPVDGSWLRCPACTTWLAAPCATCGSWSDRTLPACPWCGAEDRSEPASEAIERVGTDRPLRARRPRRRLRSMAPGDPRQPGQRRVLAPDGRPLTQVRSR
jgi:hypothetical protein